MSEISCPKEFPASKLKMAQSCPSDRNAFHKENYRKCEGITLMGKQFFAGQ